MPMKALATLLLSLSMPGSHFAPPRRSPVDRTITQHARKGGRWVRRGLSSKELSRVEVMSRVKAGNLRLGEASELLELSYRQAKRIWARYRVGGGKALQHGNCGRRSNRAYPRKLRAAVLEQVKARYEDFGPTLAAEHLASDDGLAVPAETLRRWMRQAGLWPRQRRRKTERQRRGPKKPLWGTGAVGASLSPRRGGGGARGGLDCLVGGRRL